MTYKELKNIAEARKIMIKDLAERLEMTPNGFKVSIETEKFPIGKVRDLCAALQITIAEFFGEAETVTPWMAAERQPYSQAPTVSKRETPSSETIETLVGHIAWLQSEIDRLRATEQKGKRSA